MTGIESAIETLVSGVLLPVAQAAINPVILFPVIVAALVVKSAWIYLLAPSLGVITFGLTHSKLFAPDGFEPVTRFGWVFSAAGGSIVATFFLRTVFRRFFAGSGG